MGAETLSISLQIIIAKARGRMWMHSLKILEEMWGVPDTEMILTTPPTSTQLLRLVVRNPPNLTEPFTFEHLINLERNDVEELSMSFGSWLGQDLRFFVGIQENVRKF